MLCFPKHKPALLKNQMISFSEHKAALLKNQMIGRTVFIGLNSSTIQSHAHKAFVFIMLLGNYQLMITVIN